jgi:hypothetical protein
MLDGMRARLMIRVRVEMRQLAVPLISYLNRFSGL